MPINNLESRVKNHMLKMKAKIIGEYTLHQLFLNTL